MDNYQEGDVVRRVGEDIFGVKQGAVYTVAKAIGGRRDSGSIELLDVPGNYMASRFELFVQDDVKVLVPLLPHDSKERKQLPIFSVLFGYFPAAMVALTKHCFASNEKHNPGEDMHWSRGKSDDHQDAALRHLAEGDYLGLLWRAAALLQLQLEEEGAAKAPLAR